MSLDVLKRITNLDDRFIEAAALPSPHTEQETESASYRFFHSEWWTAVLCAAVSLTVLFAIILAGRQGDGFITPAGTELPTTDESTAIAPESQYIPEIEWTADVHEDTVQCGNTCTGEYILTVDGTSFADEFMMFLVHDALSAEWEDFCYEAVRSEDGSWNCTLPANAPVGSYTLRAEIPEFGWSEAIQGALTVTPREDAYNPEFPMTVRMGGHEFTPLSNVYATGTWHSIEQDGVIEYSKFLADGLLAFEYRPEKEIAKMSTVILDGLPELVIKENVRCERVYLYSDPVYKEPQVGYKIGEVNEALSRLPSGIYYLAYYAWIDTEDHTEEILANELRMKEIFGWSYYDQYLLELEKDPKYFMDYEMGYYFIRVIVP